MCMCVGVCLFYSIELPHPSIIQIIHIYIYHWLPNLRTPALMPQDLLRFC